MKEVNDFCVEGLFGRGVDFHRVGRAEGRKRDLGGEGRHCCLLSLMGEEKGLEEGLE